MHASIARTQAYWAYDCALYGTDVCTTFWEYCYLRRQALRLVRVVAARGCVITVDCAFAWVWVSTPHTLGARA